eukprot:scaffold90054_cov75-Phaeocystis_antarctica.AAC.4
MGTRLVRPSRKLEPRIEAELGDLKRVARVGHILVQRVFFACILELVSQPQKFLHQVDIQEGVAPFHAVCAGDVV